VAATSSADDRLHLLYELNRGLTQVRDLNVLLQYAAKRVRELFAAEGCAVLLLDRERNELYFPIASDADAASEAQLATTRFPADRGIAGWMLQHDEAVAVADARADPRFFGGVDAKTQMQTRSLLGAPLRSEAGILGVLEVVNPGAHMLGSADVEFLETVAGDIAFAYERVRLLQQLRGEVVGLRQVVRYLGLSMLILGVVALLGAVLLHMARALPMSELVYRPGVVIGAASLAIGLALRRIAGGWLVAPTPES